MEGEEKLNVKQLLKDAKSCILSSSDVHRGVKIIKKILKSDSNNFWAHIYYGIAAQKTEHYSEALKIFSRSSNINPDAVESWKGIISCSKCLKGGSYDDKIVKDAYANMLRLEHDKDKWAELFATVESCFPDDVIYILSSCLDKDPLCESFKHKIASRVISLKALNDKDSGENIVLAFKAYSKSLDFYDRPIFCQKATMHLSNLKCYDGVIDFMVFSLAYGDSIYKSKIFLSQMIVTLAAYDIDKARKITPFISSGIKELSGSSNLMKASDRQMINIALGVIHYHEGNYLSSRNSFETQCYEGNSYSAVMFLKILVKMMDHEGVLFIISKLGRTLFTKNLDQQLHFELLNSLIRVLSCANDTFYLRTALKLSAKAVKSFGWHPSLLVSMCYACIGLNNKKLFYYMNKLQSVSTYSDEYEFLCALIRQRPSLFSQNSDYYTLNLLYSATLSLIRGNITKTVRNCMLAGEKNSLLSDAFLILGHYYELNLDCTKALICYDRARGNRPQDDIALRLLCDLLFKIDQEDMALNILESSRSGLFNKWHWTAKRTCLAAGEIRTVRCEFNKALSNLRHAQKLDSANKTVLEKIANTYTEMRMLGCAENYYQRILNTDIVNLKALLALTHLRKLTANYTEFYILSIKCLNCIPSPKSNSVDFRLSVAVLFSYLTQFHLNMNNSCTDSFENSMKKLTLRVIKKLNSLYQFDWSSLVTEERLLEYPVALYFFIESHLFAAIKYLKRSNYSDAGKMFQFAITATCKLIQVHGSCPAFWKLLGDILIESSWMPADIHVPAWLSNPSWKVDFSTTSVSQCQKLHLAVKCYSFGQSLVCKTNPERVHEFYYDMAVALARLSSSPESLCPSRRQNILMSSLNFACKSFVHYPSVESETDVWIHFNLIGALAAMMGCSEDLFNGPFSNFSITVSEEIRVMNYGSYYLKSGLYKEALKTFEQGRLLGDTNYAGPWVGQLLTSSLSEIGQEDEMKKLIFQLKYHGNHPLLLWICTIIIFRNTTSKEFVEEKSMLRKVLKEGINNQRVNPSRLTVLGYCLEKIGELHLARKAYFMALRSARFCENHQLYDIFIKNSIRLSGRCNLSVDLINCIDSTEIASSSFALLNLKHLSLNSFDHETYGTILFLLRHLIKSSNSSLPYIHLINIIFMTTQMVPSFPFLVDNPQLFSAILHNHTILSKYSTKNIKSIILSLPQDIQQSILYLLENYLQIEKMKEGFSPLVKLFMANETAQEVGTVIEFSGDVASPYISYVQAVPIQKKKEDKFEVTQAVSNIFARKKYPYSSIFLKMRETIFPAPIPYEEIFQRQRQKVVDIQEKFQTDQSKTNQASVMTVLVSPSLKVTNESKEEGRVIDNHGCHFSQKKIVLLMYHCLKKGLLSVTAKYCYFCLDIRCYKCLNIKKLIPLIAFLGVKLKHVKLLVKSSHLFPDEIILRKSLLLIK